MGSVSVSDVVRGHVPVSTPWSWFHALPAWQGRAACRGVGVDLFFGERADGDNAAGHEAKALCAQCPVIAECLDYGIAGNEGNYGIWGGCGESDRRVFTAARRGRPHVDPNEVPGCECSWCELFRVHLRRLDGESIPLRSDFADMTHGLRVTYNRGCRCGACRFATRKVPVALSRVQVRTSTAWELGGGDPGRAEWEAWRMLAERVAALVGWLSGRPPADLFLELQPASVDGGCRRMTLADVFLTPQDLADRWKVSKRTAERIAKERSLPVVRLTAQSVRFRLSDVEAFELDHLTEGHQEAA